MVGIPCMLMRGGTSKGAFFLASDLPDDPVKRDAVLLKVMGSPDPRQIDGVGGGHPLTSKVAIISPSDREDCDVDYYFIQVSPDSDKVSDSQNCGNLLAAVGPFALEKGLVKTKSSETTVRVYMTNSQSRADLSLITPEGMITYQGETRIDGVPGTHAAVIQNYFGTAGAQCGALLPTGNPQDEIDGIACTLIDNGMPSVLMRAIDFGISGYETPSELESNVRLKSAIEAIRLQAGPMMNLGNVEDKTIPKMCLVSPPKQGGIITTRTFIPHRLHEAVGVLAAASDAAACMIEGSVAYEIAEFENINPCRVDVEHPTGALTVELEWLGDKVIRTALIRTANKLMEGKVFP